MISRRLRSIKRIIKSGLFNKKSAPLPKPRNRPPISEFYELINYFDKSKQPPAVLFFGDSVAERTSRDDQDIRTLSEFVKANLEDKFEVASISYSAFNIKIFYYFIKALEKMKNRPQTVILPINMRSFSPQWDLEPSWQFSHEIDCINSFITDQEQTTFNIERESISTEEYNAFDSLSVKYPLSPLDKIGQFRLLINAKPATDEQRKFRLSQIFIFHYNYPLSIDHPKISFLEKALELLNRMNISVFTYITPINIESGIKYVGNEFSESIDSNIKVVKTVIKKHQAKGNISFIDCSKILTPDHFFHEDTLTEHLNEAGRKKLAALITSPVLDLK